MAEVRDFSAYAKKLNNGTERASSNGEASYKERIRNHKLKVLFRTVIIAAFLLFAAIAIYISWRDKEYSEAVFTMDATISNSADSKVVNLAGFVVQYSKDGVSCYTGSGQPVWNQTYEMQNPIAHTCNSVVAIGDYNGHHIYVSNTSGALGVVDTNLPIRDFCVSSQGVVAAVLDGTDVSWIYVYDSTGKILVSFKTTMNDSGYPVSISLSPNAELLCVSFLSPEEGALKTHVAFYNFGSVGQNFVDNITGGYEYSGIVVPYVKFMNENTAFAVSDDRLMFFSGDQRPTSKAEHFMGGEEVRSIFYDDTYVGLVFVNNTDDGDYRLQVYNTSGGLVLTTYFSIVYSDIIFNDKQIIIYNEDECVIKDMTGHDKYSGTFTDPIKVIIPTNIRSKFTLVSSRNIMTMNLK